MDSKDLEMVFVDKSKTLANGSKYFALFDKHIPSSLGTDSKVLLLALGNIDCIFKIIAKNPSAEYVVVDSNVTIEALRLIASDDVKLVCINLDKYNIFDSLAMKFDRIVMNPPYQRNLHLKILAEAIKHLKDEKSVCVNLSPVRWLQDPLAKYKKNCDLKRFENTILAHISSLETYNKKTTDDLFGIDTNILGAYVCTSTSDKTKIDEFIQKSSNYILDKVIKHIKDNNLLTIDNVVKFDDMPGICCVTSMMVFGVRDREIRMKGGWLTQDTDKLFYTNKKNDATGKTYLEYRTEVSWGNLKPKAENYNIEFNTREERQNFYNSWKTEFLRYIYDATVMDVHVHSDVMPFMGDAVNPRTGLKGYTGEWTDNDFYKFFNITPEEQKVIEETMAKYR